MIKVRHLRMLRAVAATGSLSGAGRLLGCTQPAVRQQITALEKSAGSPLIVRTGRRTRLTPAGEVLVRHADTIFQELEAAEREVAALADVQATAVRVVSFPGGGATLVPAALAALRAANPDSAVSLEEADPPTAVEMLRAGACDVALSFRHTGGTETDQWGDDLVVRPLLSDPLVALLPEEDPLACADSVALIELVEKPWIAGCSRCRGPLVDTCLEAGFTPRVAFSTDDWPTVAGLVGAGLGVAAVPRSAIGALPPRGTRAVPLLPVVRRETVALVLPALARAPAVVAALDELERAAAREASMTWKEEASSTPFNVNVLV